MRTAIIALVLLLLPAAICAAPMMGVYFTYVPGQMTYSPGVPFEMFNGYVYIQNSSCYLNAVEFMIELPPGIVPVGGGFELPVGALNLGDPYSGVAISFWPPLDGWNPGYNLVCILNLMAVQVCYPMGPIMDAPLRIVAHPGSGTLDGTCYPDNELFPIFGLTSTICPHMIPVEQKSWGTIKSLYR